MTSAVHSLYDFVFKTHSKLYWQAEEQISLRQLRAIAALPNFFEPFFDQLEDELQPGHGRQPHRGIG